MLSPEWGSTDLTASVNPFPMPRRRPVKEPSPLHRIRKRRGLTLQDVAERAGTTATQIGRLEKGERRMTWDWATRLADALDCDPTELMFGGEPPKVPIIGRVDSNGTIAPIDNSAPHHEALCPRGMNPRSTAALWLDGDALLPRGWFAFLDQKASVGPEHSVGQLCMVKLRGQSPRLLRTVRKAPTPGRYNLTAAGGQLLEDAEVEAVAPVRAILAADLATAA
jgi:transcriptional regulator with XRE-family HTH domain